ncbi:ATP-binding cassette domain-containing protein [bacterium]|nr:ATP-binding cassette domain-containing protein [bacterium]
MARIPVIKTVNLSKYYKMGKTIVRGNHKVNFEIYSGEFIIIFGQSGCGKSTLMSLLAGLDEATSGEIVIRGEKLNGLNRDQLAKYRRTKIGMVFQQYNLIKTMTAKENVALPLMFEGREKRLRLARAEKCLEIVGMGDYQDHTPAELSGGQQQRVAIARAWSTSPWIIFADEPTGNLDSKAANDIMDLLKNLNQKSKRTIVVITHNPEYRKYADRVFYLKDGAIVKIDGSVKGTKGVKEKKGLEFVAISDALKAALKKAGYDTAEKILAAKLAELATIKGINEVKAAKIQKDATKFIEQSGGVPSGSDDLEAEADIDGPLIEVAKDPETPEDLDINPEDLEEKEK